MHKGVSSVVRRVAQAGARAPFDVEYGSDFRVRLWPEENVADKHAFLGLGFRDDAEIEAMERAADSVTDGRFRFVDIGANSGMYALALVRIGRTRGLRVHGIAIEANPATFDRLAFNLSASGAAWTLANDGVIAVPCAVSDREGDVFLDTSARDLGSARVADDGVKIASRTLTSIVEEAGLDTIDMVKIDVEGHEHPALAPFFADAPSERHPKVVLAETGFDDGRLAALMSENGYRTVAQTRMDTIWERER